MSTVLEDPPTTPHSRRRGWERGRRRLVIRPTRRVSHASSRRAMSTVSAAILVVGQFHRPLRTRCTTQLSAARRRPAKSRMETVTSRASRTVTSILTMMDARTEIGIRYHLPTAEMDETSSQPRSLRQHLTLHQTRLRSPESACAMECPSPSSSLPRRRDPQPLDG